MSGGEEMVGGVGVARAEGSAGAMLERRGELGVRDTVVGRRALTCAPQPFVVTRRSIVYM